MRSRTSLTLLFQKKHFDRWIIFFVILFSLFGLLMIFESSNVSAFESFGDKYHFVKDQIVWFFIGICSMVTVSFIPYKKYYFWSLPLLLLTIIFLSAVFIPGISIKAYGARRWMGFGPIGFQPAELAKIALIIYLSAWFSNKEKGRLFSFLLLISLIVGLVILEPDLGTGVIMVAISIMIYFLSGAPLFQFLALIPITALSVFGLIISSSYRLRRLSTFLDPNADPLGASYHIRQILIALGSGGLYGIGLGASKQKYQYLPEATTDSIFAIIGEEFGFIGAVILIILFIIFLYRIFRIAKRAPDKHSFLMASGIFVLFACQFVINLSAIVALLPLTGVPLPFISYGGSSLVISFTAAGILLNISKYMVDKS